MLTGDLVLARKRAGELHLPALDAKARVRARDAAAAILGVLEGAEGQLREEIEAALEGAISELSLPPTTLKLQKGLRKLADDACTWAAEPAVDPAVLRETVFVAATAARRAGTFDRAKLLADGAAAHGVDPDDMERALYADLPSAHALVRAPSLTPDMLVEQWELGQAQAVLLRAVRVECTVRCAGADGYRALFRRLKFLRLLHRIEPLEGAYRLTIEGPFSMFDAGTKYGLQLALVLPVLRACDSFELVADLRWGKERTPLRFSMKGGTRGAQATEADLPEEVARLVDAFEGLGSKWKVTRAATILELPGVGLCVPDLVFTKGKQQVFLEVMGYWSRDAVWRRVELVEAGLPQRILFAVSQRLRVSAEVLDEDRPGKLYVYKGAMSARAVLGHLEGR